MIRALTIITAAVALAVSAAPIASAGTSKKPPARGTADCTRIGKVTSPKARGAGVINSLGQKYTASAPKPPGLTTRSGGEVVTGDAYAKAPRTLGAANDVSHLSLRKAPPEPRLVSHEDGDQI